MSSFNNFASARLRPTFSLAVLALLALPLVGTAQSGPGTYILVDNRQVVYAGDLDVSGYRLKSKEGKAGEKPKIVTWQASEVYWARVGQQRYLPVSNFSIPAGLGFKKMNHGLAEVLDSGRVTLLRYDYEVGGGGTGPAGFSTRTVSAYLLQVPDEEDALLIPMNFLSGKGAEFREMLAPHFSTRPDLLKQLEKGEVARRNLVAFVHAYNTKQPFVAKPEDAQKE